VGRQFVTQRPAVNEKREEPIFTESEKKGSLALLFVPEFPTPHLHLKSDKRNKTAPPNPGPLPLATERGAVLTKNLNDKKGSSSCINIRIHINIKIAKVTARPNCPNQTKPNQTKPKKPR
jgi:hypothetical protein